MMPMTIRKIKEITKSQQTMEGAGVRLKRAFGNTSPEKYDPFLLLDDFHSDNPNDYIKGFPSHPHRGIETITYMIHGEMKHKDSMGNGGIIKSGDVQWMTAGNGIVHSEMPCQEDGLMWGFQLWANLPSTHKMMDPRYRDIQECDMKTLETDAFFVKVICGEYQGLKGPVQDIITQPSYFDITVNPNSEFRYELNEKFTIFAYILEGEGLFSDESEEQFGKDHLILWDQGTEVKIRTKENSVRFLLISGKPINEPIAWYGPIVMNTDDELAIAFKEYREGTFLKHKK
ncbi:hypothetical protein NEF87_000342 [Candidatus Lokiarchaeum ossiferum]|uniref:Pirin family protein n=1 Tax=Candidatus Lokiarchaeum ossiferum TaxID=2951803 RepID=A0ABY6HKK6_9ARCH|nr:hypothetical protein NEF87_000342 [Candidatus Lokiarchaeum sp. B-35]